MSTLSVYTFIECTKYTIYLIILITDEKVKISVIILSI